MTKRAGDDDADDARAFEEATRGARPIKTRPRVPARPAPARGPAPLTTKAAYPDATDAPFDATSSAAFRIDVRGETISGRANGVDARTLRALAAGDPTATARLDLHGLPRERAQAALTRFVAAARAEGRRAVLVIHGRGAHSDDARPVLKPLVWRWLASSPVAADDVLAFASAPPRQGGDGATLLLLRRAGTR